MPNKVWVVQNSGHDFTATKDFGEIAFLFPDKINVFASDVLVRDIEDKLEAAKEDDYLVLSGPALANCVAYSFLLRKFSKVNVLIFGHKKGKYEIRTVRDGADETATA